jgi:hypothetical protein
MEEGISFSFYPALEEQLGLPSGRPAREAMKGGGPEGNLRRGPCGPSRRNGYLTWVGVVSRKPLLIDCIDATDPKRLRGLKQNSPSSLQIKTSLSINI